MALVWFDPGGSRSVLASRQLELPSGQGRFHITDERRVGGGGAWPEMAQSPASPSVIKILSFLPFRTGIKVVPEPLLVREMTAKNLKLGPGLALNYS